MRTHFSGGSDLRTVFFLALIALAFTAYRLADVERQRYAMAAGLCEYNPDHPRQLQDCLATAQPRTSQLWNLFYGLFQ